MGSGHNTLGRMYPEDQRKDLRFILPDKILLGRKPK
jgi:hypothetical protein